MMNYLSSRTSTPLPAPSPLLRRPSVSSQFRQQEIPPAISRNASWPDTEAATAFPYSSAVHAHIIHHHPLRKHRRLIRVPRPRSAHSNIQQQKERMVIDPLRALRQVLRSALHNQMIVKEKFNIVWAPLHRIQMKP